MNQEADYREATELMFRYLEGDATPEQAKRLSELMRGSRMLRRHCTTLLRQHLQLFELAEEEAAQMVEEKVTRLDFQESPGFFARFKWAWAGLTAAAAAIVLFLALPAARETTGDGTAVQITAMENVVLKPGGPKLVAGQTSFLKRVELAEGKLKFRVASGVNMVAMAPAEFEFMDGMLMELTRGKLTAEVEPQARGFTILTPNGRVVDLGTKFGVDVESGTGSDVVVFQGLVEVHKSDGETNQPPLAKLKAGEAVRLAGTGETQPIDSVVTGPAAYEWFSRPGEGNAVIASVRDNNPQRWSNQFYPIRRQGMAEGVYAWPYDVNKPCWWSPDAASLPTWLAGADVVQTLNEELNNRELQITVHLAKPSKLYVFYQDVERLPAWLTEHFRNTGERLLLSPDSPTTPGDPGARGSYQVRFAVWEREVREPGDVKLGALDKPNVHTEPFYMYGVAAKALDVKQTAAR